MKKYILMLVSVAFLLPACEKFFNVENTGEISKGDALDRAKDDPEFVKSYMNGCYVWFASGRYQKTHDNFGFLGIVYSTDMMGLDIAVNGTWNWGYFDINHDSGAYNYARPAQLWTFNYTLIKKANEVVDLFGEIGAPKDAMQKGFLGQAYALRAFAYLYLIQLFQDPVEGTTPDAKFRDSVLGVPIIYADKEGIGREVALKMMGRNTLADVKKEIERNLDLAFPLLKGYRRRSKKEIDYEVAHGIAARYYLLTQQWDKAAASAHTAQRGYDLMDRPRLYSGFMKVEDGEVMWGFSHTTETQTAYSSFFSHLSNDSPGYGGIGQSVHCIDRSLYDKIPNTDFRKGLFNGENGDLFAVFRGASFPYASRKFGFIANWLQDYIYMRNAEMILIEAEAHARLDDGQAKAVLAKLMAMRDPAWSAIAVTVDDVLLQRRIELWGEGFEYFDLRRNGLAVDRKYKGSNHDVSAKYLFPAHAKSWNFQIPKGEMQNNPAISEKEQNEWVSGTVDGK